ncbi:hypothetical protein ABBQ32_009159 [Trebouxia sp. C0010 RCD-2024]
MPYKPFEQVSRMHDTERGLRGNLTDQRLERAQASCGCRTLCNRAEVQDVEHGLPVRSFVYSVLILGLHNLEDDWYG